MTLHEPGSTGDVECARQLTAEAEHLFSRTIRRKEAVHSAREQATQITGAAESQDGSVRVIVDVGGMPTTLRFSHEAMHREPEELAALVTETIQQAASRARAAVLDLYAPLKAEGLIQSMPVLLPEPESAPAVVVRERRLAVDDEASNEDRQSMLRSEDW